MIDGKIDFQESTGSEINIWNKIFVTRHGDHYTNGFLSFILISKKENDCKQQTTSTWCWSENNRTY